MQKRTVWVINCEDNNKTRFVSYTLGGNRSFSGIWACIWTCKELCNFLLCMPSQFWPNCPMPASVHLRITSKIFTEGCCARPFYRLPICHDTQIGAKVSYKPQLLGWASASPSTCQGSSAGCAAQISTWERQWTSGPLRVREKIQVAFTLCRYKHFILTVGVLSIC